MIGARYFQAGLSGVGVLVLAGCANVAVVDDYLAAGGSPTTEFTAEDANVTLSARFDSALAEDERFMVEWLFPDGSVYLRKPVRRIGNRDDELETSMPIRGKAPARYPGRWHVGLWHGGDRLLYRSFEIREPVQTAHPLAEGFAGAAYCGPSRWHDPVISGRRSTATSAPRPGAWIGREVLEAAGAVYSGVILLTGCAPG